MSEKVLVLLERADAELVAKFPLKSKLYDEPLIGYPWGQVVEAAREALNLLPKRGGWVLWCHDDPDKGRPRGMVYRSKVRGGVYPTPESALAVARDANIRPGIIYTVRYDPEAIPNQK